MAFATQYQWVTQQRNGPAIGDLVRLADRRLLFQENQPPIASGSLSVYDARVRRDDASGLTEGVHELIVYRNGTPLESVFQLAKVSPTGTANDVRLNLEWRGIASYLQDAKVVEQATAYTGTTVPWSWINAFQSRTGGSYGITQGAVSGTPPSRQKLVQQPAGLFDSIQDLASTGDGFSWAINTSRQYVEWHSQRGADNGIILEPGVNVTEWAYTSSTEPGQIVTDVEVRGPAGTQSVSQSDAAARALYGRREAIVTKFADVEPSSVTTGQLAATATAALAAYNAPVIVPTMKIRANHQSLAFGSYWLGDIVTFRVRVGAYDWINQPYRIVQIEIQLDANENETIGLGLNAL